MAKFELTQAADRDLTGIYRFSYHRFGSEQADKYLLSLENCFARLAEFPQLGRSIDHLRNGYFRFEHEHHTIFYIRTETGVRIVRVLHERMDPERHL